jgi:hypothetical protein
MLRDVSPGAAGGQRSRLIQATSARSADLLPVEVTRKAPLTAPDSSILMQDMAAAPWSAGGSGGNSCASAGTEIEAAKAAMAAKAGVHLTHILRRQIPWAPGGALTVIATLQRRWMPDQARHDEGGRRS